MMGQEMVIHALHGAGASVSHLNTGCPRSRSALNRNQCGLAFGTSVLLDDRTVVQNNNCRIAAQSLTITVQRFIRGVIEDGYWVVDMADGRGCWALDMGDGHGRWAFLTWPTCVLDGIPKDLGSRVEADQAKVYEVRCFWRCG